MQHLSSTLVALALAAVSVIVLIGSGYALYRIVKYALEAIEKRKHEQVFEQARKKAAEYPPPAGMGIGCCVAVHTNPDDPSPIFVKYVIVTSYSVLELGDERVWVLHCDNGESYMHTSVMRVPGGIPDPPKERSENTIGMGST